MHKTVKIAKIQSKETILQTVKETCQLIYKGKHTRIVSYLSSAYLKDKEQNILSPERNNF